MAASSSRPVGIFRPRKAARHGFTLVEMLVVIGIILVILGLTAPMLTRAWRSADRAGTYADLQAIGAALDAYRADHGDYPRVFAPPKPIDDKYNGARMLCRALIGPGPGTATGTALTMIADGAGTKKDANDSLEQLPGPGFRIRTQGKVYGPYLQVDRFKLGDPNTPARTEPGYLAIIDRYNNPILYYPASGKWNLSAGSSPFIGDYPSGNLPPTALYNARDNLGPMNKRAFAQMMGSTKADGSLAATDTPAYEGPYLLWSSGPDEAFGPNPAITSTAPLVIRKAVEKCDDVTNFRK